MSVRVRLFRLGEGEDRSAWAAALADRPWTRGELVKQDGARAVWRASVLGSSVSVKVRPMSWLRRYAVGTEYQRSVRAERWLRTAGVETAPLFAHAALGREEILVHAWLEGPTLLEALRDADDAERSELLRAAGTLIGRQLRHVLFNRDHKPSNVVVIDRGSRTLALVDVGGVRRMQLASSDVLVRAASRMTASICLEPAGVGVQLKRDSIMAMMDSVAVEACSLASGITASDFRAKVFAASDRIVASHGDPTPKVNPLQPPSST